MRKPPSIRRIPCGMIPPAGRETGHDDHGPGPCPGKASPLVLSGQHPPFCPGNALPDRVGTPGTSKATARVIPGGQAFHPVRPPGARDLLARVTWRPPPVLASRCGSLETDRSCSPTACRIAPASRRGHLGFNVFVVAVLPDGPIPVILLTASGNRPSQLRGTVQNPEGKHDQEWESLAQ